jgi:replicative DNA helicase
MAKVNKEDLSYLSEDFQNRLILQVLTDKKFAMSIIDILEPSYFKDSYLKVIVAEIKNAYDKHEVIPDLGSIETRITEKLNNDIDTNFYKIKLNNIKECSLNDTEYIQETAMKFCKRQELKKAIKDIDVIINDGKLDEYDDCESILRKALDKGQTKDDGIDIFENIDAVLEDDYRKPIPTGISGLDSIMGGGLSKGELAVILAAFGIGKAQPLTSKILTPNGWIKMGDVKVGTEVISRNGNSTKVIGVYPQGIRPIYKVSFNDDTSTLCDKEHLWSLKHDGPYSVLKTSDLIGKLDNKYYLPKLLAVNFNDNGNVDLIELATKIVNGESIDVDINDVICNSIDSKLDFLNIISEKGVFNESGNVVTFNHSNIDVLHLIREVFFSIGHKAIISDDKTSINLYEEQIERYITSIEYSHDEEAQCIMVDNDEHLYITDDYIVTHNTTMFTKLANHAYNEGYNVLQIFFEDMPKVIQRKHIACWTGINLSELGEYKEEIKETLELVNQSKGNLKLKKFPSSDTTMTTIKQYVRKQIAQGFRPDIILIDYIDCVQPSKKVDDVNIGEGQVMREFESMLTEFDMAGWTAIQGGRCVCLDTNITIENKGVIKIGDVKLGDKILTHKGYKEITNIFPIEKQQVYKIKTKSGKEIKVSAKHDFPIDSGVLKSIRNGLSVGDKLFLKKD